MAVNYTTPPIYRYIGDRMTKPEFKGALCAAVRIWVTDKNGNQSMKCLRGRNGLMLVEFYGGERSTVIGRLLRKV